MKAPVWRKFAQQHLLPSLGGGVVAGSFVAIDDGSPWVVTGIAVESSNFSATKFALRALALPTFIPTTHVYFTYGARIGALAGKSEIWWDVGGVDDWQERAATQTLSEARPFFQEVGHPAGLCRYIERTLLPSRSADPRVMETLAYALLLAEMPDVDRALSSAESATRAANVVWAASIADRLEAVHDALSKGPEDAVALLSQWRDQTVRALKLQDWARSTSPHLRS